MKQIIKVSVWIVVVMLVAANIILFRYSIELGKDIAPYETNTKALHEENLRLEKQVSKLTSLEFAKAVAGELNFSKVATPVYLDVFGLAQQSRP